MRKKKSVENTGSTGEKTLKLDYPQTFKVGFAFAIIMLFWTAYDFVVPLLLEHAHQPLSGACAPLSLPAES